MWDKIQQEYRNYFNKSEEDVLDLNYINNNLVVEDNTYAERGYVARKDKSGNFILTLNNGYKVISSKDNKLIAIKDPNGKKISMTEFSAATNISSIGINEKGQVDLYYSNVKLRQPQPRSADAENGKVNKAGEPGATGEVSSAGGVEGVRNLSMNETYAAWMTEEMELEDFILTYYINSNLEVVKNVDAMGGFAKACSGVMHLFQSDSLIDNLEKFYEGDPSDNKDISTIKHIKYAQMGLDSLRRVGEKEPDKYQETFLQKYEELTGTNDFDINKAKEFRDIADRFENSKLLGHRVELLKEAISKLDLAAVHADITAVSPVVADKCGINSCDPYLEACKLLKQYFNGDQESVDLLLGRGYLTVSKESREELLNILKDMLKNDEAELRKNLNGQDYDRIKADYIKKYKEMYHTDIIPDEILKKIDTANAVGCYTKLAAVTIVSILLTRSPIIARALQSVGGIAADGEAMAFIDALVSKYGQAAVQQGVKLAMTTASWATDVGFTILDQALSNNGVDWESVGESALNSAKYIYLGSYVGGPIAGKVSSKISSMNLAGKLFGNGTKVITGKALQEGLVKYGNKVLSSGGGLLTEIGVFTGAEAAEGADLESAFSSQSDMLPKLKVMNAVIEYMLGGKVHAGFSKTKIDTAIKMAKLNDMEIKEVQTDGRTEYEVVTNGKSARFKSMEDATVSIIEKVAKCYEEANPEAKSSASQSSVESVSATESRLMQSLEQANDRQTFAKIRDEIKKMPVSKEKSRLMEAYMQKYNAWSVAPERPDVRAEYTSSPENPHNITQIATPEEVGARAEQALSGSKHRIATAGYSAPPEGYEAATRDFLSALDTELGSSETAFITSPTADKGSIDAITTEVAGFDKGRLFYTTAQDYVEYINPENFPATIDKASYSEVPKFVLPDASSYSAATAKASNTFIATGGRNATVSDYVNAIKNGNKSVILDNTSLDVPAWGEAKGRVENASSYISEQIKAVKEGRELPYPEVGEFTREFIEKNLSEIENLTRIIQIDGTEASVKAAAKDSAAFINGQEVTSQTTSKSVAKQQANISTAVTTELKELYNKKNLTQQEKARVEELEQEIQSHGILVARSPIIENSKISMLAKSEPREALLPDFNNPEQLRELGFTQEADGKWYHSNRDWYPNGLSENDVIYVFKRDTNGNAIDTGFGPKEELTSLYVRTEDFDTNNMKFVNPNEMTPGQVISVKKCASGNFCILPAGTQLFTSEGIVEVKPGEIVNVKEGKNSVHTSNMTDITDMYKADPLNPASKKLFDLIEEYKSKESTLTETEKASFQARIADTFNRINRGQKLCELSPDAAQNPPQTLRDEYDLAAKIATNLESKYLSRIDVSNFDTALSQAKEVLTEIYADKSLTPEQQNAAVTAVMVKLLPKTNAHQHTKGSLPKETALQLAEQKGYTPEQIAELKAAYQAGKAGFATLDDFNNAYGTIGRLVNTPSDYKIAIDGIIRKAVEEGQLTTEIRCACDSLKDENGRYLSPEEGTQVILDAIEETKAQLRAEGKEVPATGYVFLTYRGRDWDASLPAAVTQAKQAVKTAMEHPDMKFGFDIAGPEDSGWGPKAFEESVGIIREYNEKVDKGEVPGQRIGITMHAGETPTFDGGRPGYLSVQEAIEMGADRIGHGVQAVLDEPTMQMMKDAGVTVEICGVCNIQSIPVNTEGLSIHPIQQFIDKGIKVSLCTDNDAICGSNITKEYNQFLLTGHSSFMNWNNVKQSARDGIEAAFIPDAAKVEARATLESRINQVQKIHDEVLGKAEAQAKLEDAAKTNRPAPIVPSAEAVEAAKGDPTNAHVRVSETESRREETPTAFYEGLSAEQKATVDKYGIAHDDVVNIHGALKIKLTKYDTPEIIESRFNAAVNGGSLRSADIPKATLENVAGIQRAKMAGVPRERKLYLITGRAGGGKSTIAGKLKLDKTTFMPDADELKPLLPGYKENGAGYVHEASVALNTASIQEAFSKGINMTIQTTGWEAYIDEIVAQAKENGYEDIVLIHTDVTTENSIQRAMSRAAATGRTVDPAFIESRTYIDEVVDKFSNPQKGIKEIIVYDNNGSAPVEVRRFSTSEK